MRKAKCVNDNSYTSFCSITVFLFYNLSIVSMSVNIQVDHKIVTVTYKRESSKDLGGFVTLYYQDLSVH